MLPPQDQGNGNFQAERARVSRQRVFGGPCAAEEPYRRAASLDLPDRDLVPNGFRLLSLTEAETKAAVQREWEARTSQWEEMGRRGGPREQEA